MGQLCGKCVGEEEQDGRQQENRDTTDSPLLSAAEPPAIESPLRHSPVLESPAAESFSLKSSDEECPVAEPLVAKLPSAESPVAKSRKVAPPVAESSVPQVSAAPVSEKHDDRVGSSGPALAPGTSAPAFFFTPPEGDHLDFPILQDTRTVEYVQRSKVSGQNIFVNDLGA